MRLLAGYENKNTSIIRFIYHGDIVDPCDDSYGMIEINTKLEKS